MIFTKEYASTSDTKVEVLYKEKKIHYKACLVSLIKILCTRVDLCFAFQNLAKFSSNTSKVRFEGLVHLLMSPVPDTLLIMIYYV